MSKARENYQKAIEVHKRLNHPLVAATLVHNLGYLYQEQGIYDSALTYTEEAASIFLEHKDSLKYASSLDLMSAIHQEKGDYFLSLQYATLAADLFRDYGDKLREADALIKIGAGYNIQQDYAKSITYYLTAIDRYRKYNDVHWENFAVQRIAEAYLAMDKIEKADSTIDRSLHLSDSIGAVQMLGEGHGIKGDVLFAKGFYNQALEEYTLALDINTGAGDSTFIATKQIAIGRCYQALGMEDKALTYFVKTLPISIKMDVKENMKTIYSSLASIYDSKGNSAIAYDYFKKYVAAKDTIYQNEKARQFADMQTKYDSERKEREIRLQEQTITILEQKGEIQELIRLRLIVTIIVVIVLFVLVFYVLWLRMKKNKLKQDIENERLTHELDLKKRELTTHTLHIIQKNELLEDLQQKVSELKKKDTGTSFGEITRLINTNRLIDKDWDNFKSVFEQVHPDFFVKLKARYGNISVNELRMAAMMKMNLTSKEMASILNITPESVKKARYRMRKKLELEPEADVHEYLMNF